ncbi:MAG: DUF723 domain-containing protein [Gammaproteobacteria bacterium]|nr:DUF723 domain-containing protein [Gammaproteobacteria bacterium]
MPKKLTQEEWLERARKVHGDRYDYSRAVYTLSSQKVTIGCPEHGWFEQGAAQHLYGKGCPECGKLLCAEKRAIPFAEFVSLAREVHGGRFTYIEGSYRTLTDGVKILCPEHGEFEQAATTHLKSKIACPVCNNADRSARNLKSTDYFVEKAKSVHGETYDYSKTEYTGASNKVTITCRVHGDFLQSPMDHTHSKAGCPKCASERLSAQRITPLEEYIEKAREIHGAVYDYSKVTYRTTSDKVTIGCKVHGDFELTAAAHVSLRASGCPKCGIESRGKKSSDAAGFVHDKESLIDAVRERHGDSLEVLSDTCSRGSDMLRLRCPVHGEFERLALEILKDVKGQKKGCPACGLDLGADKRRYDAEKFIKKLEAVNTRGYRLKDTELFVSTKERTTFVCPSHGDFEATPKALIQADGNKLSCPKCFWDHLTHDTEKFIEKATDKWGYAYSYDKVEYTKAHDYVTVTCPDHGDFQIKAYSHLNGSGCPRCTTSGVSQMESDLCDYVAGLGVMVVPRTKQVIPPQEIDIFLPEHRIGIEFCGVYWHSEDYLGKSYHQDKLNRAVSADVRLLTIFEDEFMEKRKIVEELIKRRIGGTDIRRLGARTLTLEKVDPKTAGRVYKEHHLQGAAAAEAHFALLWNGQIACAASFSRASSRAFIGGPRPESDLEVVRFCSHPQIVVSGGLERLVSAALRHFGGVQRVVSYVDLRWFTGSGYAGAGFEMESVSKPGYFYVKGQKRFSRFSFAKHTLEAKLPVYDPALSEHENMRVNGYLRLYDCGHAKMVKSA